MLMIDEQRIGKNLEGKNRDLITVLSRRLAGVVRKTTNNLNQYSQLPGLDSNRAPPEYNSRWLPPHRPVPLDDFGMTSFNFNKRLFINHLRSYQILQHRI
jgi:hypothetical protein